jgi:hypothetical protein
MLIPTQNDWNIGKIWNPFDADYTEEFKKEMKEDKIKRKRIKQTLSVLFSFVGSNDFRRI